MSATFRHQTIAGHSVGASKSFGVLMAVIMMALVFMNAYHLSNFLVSKLTSPEGSFIFKWALMVVGAGIACIEIPLAKSMVTSYRLHGFSSGTIIQGLLAIVVTIMAIVAGISSQLADTDRRDTQTASYQVTDGSFANMERSAEMARDSALHRANRIHDEESKLIAKIDAERAYQDQLIAIAQQKAAHTLHKPVQMIQSGTTEHYIVIALFSIVCSVGAIFCSAFSAVFINPLVAMPAFSLKAKANHDWQSDGSDFKTVQHELSPLANKFSGYLGREKVAATVNNTALPSAENNDLTSTNNRAAENRPHVEDTRLGAVLNPSESVGVRTPNEDNQQGGKVDYSNGHYLTIKEGILSGGIKPTVRPVKAQLVKLKVRFVDDAARQQKAVDILDQLHAEGVLIDNPDFGKSGQVVAKFMLNPNYQSASNDLEGQRKPANRNITLDEPVSCICPECGKQERIVETTPKGRVKSSCGAIYVAADHLVDDSPKKKIKVTPAIGAGVGVSEEGLSPIAGIGALISK
ncbi:hypothetical protein [Leucothrix mucor]|uniref:hypothetical protein n=1 Tax=Leucothrix mucor TaxID=45248 RepID=UPI0003B4B283|nr:hypothetical protein [Leucothrix mucor]